MIMAVNGRLMSSFRDTSGYIFLHHNRIFRRVNMIYRSDYDMLKKSGLWTNLVNENDLINHREVELNSKSIDKKNCYKIIQPLIIPFVSYPYEWCFQQLKEAASLILKIQKIALGYNMSLKDASAYNVQFLKGKAILIDTLSFEKLSPFKPWAAYKQFCQHFLAPLALMRYKDLRLNQLCKIYLDGIPLELTTTLLPARALLNRHILLHIILHARSQQIYSDKPHIKIKSLNNKMSKNSLYGLIDSLQEAVANLKGHKQISQWAKYYQETNYSDQSFLHKKNIVDSYLKRIKPKVVWDLGANTGIFSRVAADVARDVVSFDIDHAAVELNYLYNKHHKISNILPLILDLTNPSPATGWRNSERMTILQRANADTVLALALIHHLAIANNLPLEYIADFFRSLGKYLIMEFVPKSDSQVKRLLENRQDIFDNYTQVNFEKVFGQYFTIIAKNEVKDSSRIIYLMKRK